MIDLTPNIFFGNAFLHRVFVMLGLLARGNIKESRGLTSRQYYERMDDEGDMPAPQGTWSH